MRLTHLKVSNFLGLEDFELEAGKVVLARGPNAAGKTSIIKAISAAFVGETDPKVIHHDGETAEVFVQLDNGMSIRRVIGAGGATLDVRDADDEKVAKPQTVIKALLGALAFNPVEFYALSARERKQYLLRALEVKIKRQTVEKWCGEVPAGVDLDRHGLEVLKSLEEHYFALRHEIHAKALDREGGAKEIAAELPEGFAPDVARSLNVHDLMEVVNRHEAAEAARAERTEAVAAAREALAAREAEVEQLAMRVARAKEQVKAAVDAVEKTKGAVGEVRGPDASAVKVARETLAEYDRTKKVLARHEEMTRLMDDAKTARDEWAKLDALVKFLQTEAPREILEKLPPVAKGLKIDGENLTLNGTPLDHLSSGEQLRFAVEIARALAGDLKLLCVDGIERLDPEAREAFMAQCKGDAYQYVLTEVAGGKMKVTSTNGDVKKAKLAGRKA
ncbi:MAG TPA: AAA family ATPase [Candidatus Thermoplasmatota archaeon]|nr:AAA family ATPase [Candidatus Thermoplasmatota archaeon]